MTSSILQQKSLELGINVAKFSISLKDQKMFEIASQFLKSGTSVGANIAEARWWQSMRDFIHKLEISLKEAYETQYWCDILEQWFNIECNIIRSLCEECIKLLVTSIKTAKSKEK